jgi:hypothetical protein
MNPQNKQLPVPSLTAEQVKFLINYLDSEIPNKWSKLILGIIESIAIELDKAPSVQEPSLP